MTATAGTTTIEVPIPLRDRLAAHRMHPRQPYHEVIGDALDALDLRQRGPGLDPLILAHQRALRRAARDHRLRRIWLFGSRARGEARPDSDVDLIYKAEAGADLWDIAAFLTDAQEILGLRVDLVDLDHMSDRLRKTIMADAVVV